MDMQNLGPTGFDNRPIGVFDSGIGGLTVLKSLMEALPNERFLYVGDTARVPYGNKSPNTIGRYTEEILHFLLQKNVKMFVIACNSASSHFPQREFCGQPVYNVIDPGCEEALRTTRIQSIAVLGTRATVFSRSYAERIQKISPQTQVLSIACPLFVPLAEEGWIDSPITLQIASQYVQPVRDAHIDTVVLGCTHYPLLKAAIQAAVGIQAKLVDSGEALGRAIRAHFDAAVHLPASAKPIIDGGQNPLELFCTDDPAVFDKMASQILPAGHFQNVKKIAIP